MEKPDENQKLEKLAEANCLNVNSKSVKDSNFIKDNFFDPNDLIQVKYEMVRKVEVEGWSISNAANEFGMSRPTFYEAKEQIEKEGVFGLIPKRRGPKSPHKITDEILNFITEEKQKNVAITANDLTERIEKKFKTKIHPRSLDRAIKQRNKKK